MQDFSKNQKITFVIGGLIIILVIGYYMLKSFQTNEAILISDSLQLEDVVENEEKEVDITKIEENPEQIIVHIAGSVKQEGIIKTKEGARIADIIELAGGLKENSDLSSINLAYKVEDGQKIYIPYHGEELSKVEEVEEKKEELVNINTATKEELETLSGIGSATAAKIMEYRKTKGKFQTIDDIKNVSGIGEAKFLEIKEKICVK